MLPLIDGHIRLIGLAYQPSQMSFVLWMTGLPCSGKTTIARELRNVIPNIAILDGDELREWLSPKDFSREGRNDHNKRVAYLSRLLSSHKVPVCVSLISPYEENRKTARSIIGPENFVEVYVNCPLEICESRDVKGMYKKARNNEIRNFTGISDPYEVPKSPDLLLETEKKSISDCVKTIIDYLKSKNFL